ncbi:MAG: CYTH domain-containing protein [Clostridia bacterium]|nr:CYTH domain-containing protein [Clostridia bacterium]
MGKEIERKFRVVSDSYKNNAQGILYKQGYLSNASERVVRIRVYNNKGYLTVKAAAVGAVRQEFEYEIPYHDAEEMLNHLCQKPIIEKHRYKIDYCGFTWEVDEFHGENEGLVVAEIELQDENQPFPHPSWLGEEVTHDYRYQNSNLITNPYTKWSRP